MTLLCSRCEYFSEGVNIKITKSKSLEIAGIKISKDITKSVIST